MIEQWLTILAQRWGINALNPMQQAVARQADTADLVIYAPTGSGKTIAFALPLVEALRHGRAGVQAVVIVPARELALQTHDVLRTLAQGYKVTCLYGGHRASDERLSLTVTPDVLVATPGRLLDHVKHGRVDLSTVQVLVLDEFDKCLELGFADDMRQLLRQLPNKARRLLTSATRLDPVPDYVALRAPVTLDFLSLSPDPAARMTIHAVHAPMVDKLPTLLQLLLTVEPARTIVFVGYRDAVARVADFLARHHVSVASYHGALTQIDRERALALLRGDAVRVMVTTDLAARGLDIDQVRHIVHYHQPTTAEAYTHRNGRTARVDACGEVYVMLGPDEKPAQFIAFDDQLSLPDAAPRKSLLAPMTMLHIQTGKKEKISRADIMGFIAKNCDDLLPPSDIGRIEVKDHHTLVAVPHSAARQIIARLSPLPLKGRRTRITVTTAP